MKKSIKNVVVVLFTVCISIVGSVAFACGHQKIGELDIIDMTITNFYFMSVSGEGIAIVGNPNMKPRDTAKFLIGGDKAKGEIKYVDSRYNQIINFDYDYTQPGGYVTVKGGEQYYQFNGRCTLNGNEIVITNKL